jgi:BASS family bile acid:Na+ symporter
LLKGVIDLGVPVSVFLPIAVVRTELTTLDFRRVARQPLLVLAAISRQVVMPPALGWLLIHCLDPLPTIARGLLLVTACPSGAMANVYTCVARGNVALSVTLTIVSCLTPVLAPPLALTLLQAQVAESTRIPVPCGVLAGQLVLLLVLPVLTGMAIRRRRPDITKRHAPGLLGIIVAALGALLGFVIIQEAAHFVSAPAETAAVAAVLRCSERLISLLECRSSSRSFRCSACSSENEWQPPRQSTHEPTGSIARPPSHRAKQVGDSL